jgi:hypothetical protein
MDQEKPKGKRVRGDVNHGGSSEVPIIANSYEYLRLCVRHSLVT